MNLLDCICIVPPGTEKSAETEFNEKFDLKGSIISGGYFFKADIVNAAKAAFKVQAASRVGIILSKVEVHESTVDKIIEQTDFSMLEQTESIRIESIKIQNKDLSGYELAQKLAKKIAEKLKCKIDLKSANTPLFVFLNKDNLFLCLDLVGFDLSKREYKVFSVPRSMKGNVAYSILVSSGYRPGNILLDPHCGSAEFPIEAALWSSNKAPFHYKLHDFAFLKLKLVDENQLISGKTEPQGKINAVSPQMRHIKAGEKNAKVAGVHDKILFSRIDTDWLSAKFDKGSIDNIVAYLPSSSKKLGENTARKFYAELFRQIIPLISDKGRISIAVQNDSLIKEVAKLTGLTIVDNSAISTGQGLLRVCLFGK